MSILTWALPLWTRDTAQSCAFCLHCLLGPVPVFDPLDLLAPSVVPFLVPFVVATLLLVFPVVRCCLLRPMSRLSMALTTCYR